MFNCQKSINIRMRFSCCIVCLATVATLLSAAAVQCSVRCCCCSPASSPPSPPTRRRSRSCSTIFRQTSGGEPQLLPIRLSMARQFSLSFLRKKEEKKLIHISRIFFLEFINPQSTRCRLKEVGRLMGRVSTSGTSSPA